MRYFSFIEYLCAMLASCSFGAAFGILKEIVSVICFNLRHLFYFFFLSIKSKSYKELKSLKKGIKYRAEFYNRFSKNLFDFIYYVLFFITYILLTYAFLDGVVRFYTLFFYIAFFYLSGAIFKKMISEKIFIVLLNLLFSFISIFYFILLPVKFTVNIFLRIFYFVISPIKRYMFKRASKRIFNQKTKEMRNVFLKTYKI